jgi:hypothetical protein
MAWALNLAVSHVSTDTMQHLSGVWADVLAWAAILLGLAACAAFFARGPRPRRPPAPLAAIAPADLDLAAPEAPRRLGRAQEWSLIVGRASQDLERGARLAALQSEAALKLAAAEHAFNRLVADYASLHPHTAMSPITPPPQHAAGPRTRPHPFGRPADRRPLAA